MATARKHWFRVADSILRDGWGDSELATMIRLSAYLNDRWARDGIKEEAEICSALISSTQMGVLTGRKRLDSARLVLRKLSDRITLRISYEGDKTLVVWPKWAEFQNLAPPSEGGRNPENSPSETPPQDADADAEETPAPPVLEPPPPEPLRLALLLGETIPKSIPGARLPRTMRQLLDWVRDMDRLHRLEPSSVTEIEATIRWLPTHSGSNGFRWGQQILSPKKLREKYPQLQMARREGSGQHAADELAARRARQMKMLAEMD